MRVECESCKELVVATFVADGGAVRATCSACHATMTAGAAEAAVPARELCPKCGAPRSADAKACRSCGLATDRMTAFAAARDAAVPDPVRAAWDRVVEDWNDDGRHDDLMRLVAHHNCYAWAAGRYMARKGDRIAERQLDRLRRAAEATMLATATSRRDPVSKPYRATATILVMMIVAIGAGLVYAMLIREHGASHAGEATPAEATPRTLDPSRPMHQGSQVR